MSKKTKSQSRLIVATVPSHDPKVSEQRRKQAAEIMHQLIAEGYFAPDEAAGITFSDAEVAAIPQDTKKSKVPQF